jgi:trans-aconitate methyltransferase
MNLARSAIRTLIFGGPLRSARNILRPAVRAVIGERAYNEMLYTANMRLKASGGYDDAFFEHIEQHNESCYPLLAGSLINQFHPESLVDVGCGSGGISQAFFNAGVREVHSFDYSEAALERARARGLPDVRKIDIGLVDQIPAKADLCICLEVAEHLPESLAFKLCVLLSEVAPTLVMTAAPPEQGGEHLHINEQPQEYWISLMNRVRMRFDGAAVRAIRKAYAGKMIKDYDQNLMVFRRMPSHRIWAQ